MIDQESNEKITHVTGSGAGFGVLAILLLALFTVVIIGGISVIQTF